MKYYIASIRDCCGEYEWDSVILIKTEENNIDEILDYHVSVWYGSQEDSEEDDGIYSWSNGEVTTCAGGYSEITESTFNDLKKNTLIQELGKEI
jgi:hypothetical protein